MSLSPNVVPSLDYTCLPEIMKCDDGKECVFISVYNDLYPHCNDGSDSLPENCRGKKPNALI